MFNYNNINEYYEEISLKDKIKNINIPTFMLSTKDDFLFPDD